MGLKADYLPRDAMYLLRMGCEEIEKAYPNVGVYLVGSALERGDYRDVDIRAIMHDEEFDATFGGHGNRLGLTCMALSAWLKNMTGLPIDFQFQRMSIANARHKGPRNAMFVVPWVGDGVKSDKPQA